MTYAKLRGAIREKYGTQADFANAMNIATTTLSAKLNGKAQWTKSDIVNGCNLLDIPLSNAFEYFLPK